MKGATSLYRDRTVESNRIYRSKPRKIPNNERSDRGYLVGGSSDYSITTLSNAARGNLLEIVKEIRQLASMRRRPVVAAGLLLYKVVRLALRYVLGGRRFGYLQGNQRGVRELAS